MASDADLGFMQAALAEADRAPLHGDIPVGCLVVSAAGEVLASDHNRREELEDPTAHAEVLALREAARKVGRWRLDGATVYATLEPCPMCAGALVSARIARLVYATRDPKAGAVDSLFSLGKDPRLNHRFQVEDGLCAAAAAERLSSFFANLRRLGKK